LTCSYCSRLLKDPIELPCDDSICREHLSERDVVSQKKTKLESDVFDHFQEMRFQIDEHRERLKERIDEIALKMIDDTKEDEVLYLNSLKVSFSSFDQSKSLKNELNQIEDTFRHPNLLVTRIKEMQGKQNRDMIEIQFKINEIMNQVKYDIKWQQLNSNQVFLIKPRRRGFFIWFN
jgi:hypothetical protein